MRIFLVMLPYFFWMISSVSGGLAKNASTEVENDENLEQWSRFSVAIHLLLPVAGLALIWQRKDVFSRLWLHLDRNCVSVFCPSFSKREKLLKWAGGRLPSTWSSQARTLSGGVPDLWSDGSLLCTLINSAIPGACPNPHRHWKKTPLHAQAIAYKYLGVVPVFTEQDLSGPFTSRLERNFLHYLNQLHLAIGKLSENKNSAKNFTCQYLPRGMGLFTGEQHRKTVFYIYPNPIRNSRNSSSIIIQIRGPYGTFGKAVVPQFQNSSPTPEIKVSDFSKMRSSKPKNMFLRSFSTEIKKIMKYHKKHTGDNIVIDVTMEEGRARVSYIPKNYGMYEINLVANGELLMGCPFNVHISNNNSGMEDTFDVDFSKEDTKPILKRKVISKTIDFIDEQVPLDEFLKRTKFLGKHHSSFKDVLDEVTKNSLIVNEKEKLHITTRIDENESKIEDDELSHDEPDGKDAVIPQVKLLKSAFKGTEAKIVEESEEDEDIITNLPNDDKNINSNPKNNENRVNIIGKNEENISSIDDQIADEDKEFALDKIRSKEIIENLLKSKFKEAEASLVEEKEKACLAKSLGVVAGKENLHILKNQENLSTIIREKLPTQIIAVPSKDEIIFTPTKIGKTVEKLQPEKDDEKDEMENKSVREIAKILAISLNKTEKSAFRKNTTENNTKLKVNIESKDNKFKTNNATTNDNIQLINIPSKQNKITNNANNCFSNVNNNNFNVSKIEIPDKFPTKNDSKYFKDMDNSNKRTIINLEPKTSIFKNEDIKKELVKNLQNPLDQKYCSHIIPKNKDLNNNSARKISSQINVIPSRFFHVPSPAPTQNSLFTSCSNEVSPKTTSPVCPDHIVPEVPSDFWQLSLKERRKIFSKQTPTVSDTFSSQNSSFSDSENVDVSNESEAGKSESLSILSVLGSLKLAGSDQNSLTSTTSLPNIPATCEKDIFRNTVKEKKDFWEKVSSGSSTSLNQVFSDSLSNQSGMSEEERSKLIWKKPQNEKQLQRKTSVTRKSADDIPYFTDVVPYSKRYKSMDNSLDRCTMISIEERKKLLLKHNYEKERTEREMIRRRNSIKDNEKKLKMCTEDNTKIESVETVFSPVSEKIRKFDNGSNILTKNPEEKPGTTTNSKKTKSKENKPQNYIHNDLKKLPPPQKLSIKSQFKKAINYFKNLEEKSSKKSRVKGQGRRYSLDLVQGESKIKKKGGSLNLPNVSERFSINNLYADVFGNKKVSSFRGTPNRTAVAEALATFSRHENPDVSVEDDEIRYNIFKNTKRKQRKSLRAIFDVYY